MAGELDLDRIARIDGKLPADLRGTLYRIGAGKTQVGSHRYDHWFDGDGMVCAFRFDGEHVAFKNRFVRTEWYQRETAAGRPLVPSFGTPVPGGAITGILRNAMRRPKNPANTNAVVHAGRLLALWEGGRPYAMDPDSLETLGEETFGGGLPKGAFFSAHPHPDPATGAIYNVGPVIGPKPALRIWCVSKAGRCEAVQRIALDKPFMIHDFGLTATKVVVMGGPFYLEPKRMPLWLLGRRSLLDCFAWHPEQAMCVYVAARNGDGPARTYELDPALMFHVANAFDDGGDVVIDAVLYPDDGPLHIVADTYNGRTPSAPPGRLVRVRLRADGSHSLEPLADMGLDFPRIHDGLSTQPYRYAYCLEFRAGEFASSRVLKVDAYRARVAAHDWGDGCFAGEPVFVPRPGARNEDDGWVLSLVYDANDHHSFVGIVDARGFGGADIRVHLPFHTPLGFHGSFHAHT